MVSAEVAQCGHSSSSVVWINGIALRPSFARVLLEGDDLLRFHLNATSTHVCSLALFQIYAIRRNPANAAERRPEGFAISKACDLSG